MLVGRLISYEQIHVCVTKVKIPKAKLTFATKMTAMINMSSLLCGNILSSSFWYCATLCYVTFLRFLLTICQIIATATRFVDLTKAKYFKGVYMKKDNVKKTTLSAESYNLLTSQISNVEERIYLFILYL